MSEAKRYTILLLVVVVVAGSIFYLGSKKAKHGGSSVPYSAENSVVISTSTPKTDDYEAKAKQFQKAQELVKPDGYINTNGQPLTLSSLIGKKVILLDFWTYSCINCQRTIPYLNDWYKKYKDEGLEIVGVHTPEFDFEKKIENVQGGVDKFGIMYPVVLDNEYATWDAYQNQYWPEHYLIDINGLVVDRHIGEGGYADTEKLIQQLLEERKKVLGESGTISKDITTIDQKIEAQSPETYFGASRNTYLANGAPQVTGAQSLTIPSSVSANKLYLGGTWNFDKQFAENVSKDATITYKYNSKNVYFVASAAQGVSITVMRDGKVVDAEKGEDVDASGNVMIKESRLYKLINESEQGTHTIEIIIHGAGLDAFTFTFG